MTSIGGNQPFPIPAAQPSVPGSEGGEAIQARVLGATRHGVSVQIGQKQFQLDVPSTLANARTLVLHGTALPTSSGQKVQVIAVDDRPLPKPITADLTTRVQTLSSPASAIVETGRIRVVAQPVSADGRVTGPGVALHLQTRSPTAAAKAGTASLQSAATDTAQRVSTAAERQLDRARPSGPALGNEGANASFAGAGKSDGSGTAAGAARASAPAVPPQPNGIASRPGDALSRGDLATQHRSGPAAASSADGHPTPMNDRAPSFTSALGNGRGHEPAARSAAFYQPSPSVEPDASPEQIRGITATVIGRTQAGKVILQAADQLLRVEQPVDLPIGATLHATLASGALPSTTSSRPAPSGDLAASLTRLIALLDVIDQAGLQAAEPDRHANTRQLPAPDRHLASRFLGLLAAQSDPLPDPQNTSLIDQDMIMTGRKEQIQSLIRDLASMASEPLAEGWKGLTLPVGHDQTQAVWCYFKDQDLDPDEQTSGDDAERSDARRAIFDVSFSRLGRCQIDALCHERRFDLQVRTEMQLSQGNQDDITSLFVSACEIAGMAGDIGFKTGNFFEPARLSGATRDVTT